MKIVKKNKQFRTDYECENCGNIEKDKNGYDDRYFYDNVVPNMKCKKCCKSRNMIDEENELNCFDKCITKTTLKTEDKPYQKMWQEFRDWYYLQNSSDEELMKLNKIYQSIHELESKYLGDEE